MNKKSLSLAVSTSAYTLLATYIVAVASACYPYALLDPAWQLNFATNAVDNGGIALLGLLLFASAASLNPRDNQKYQKVFQRAIWPMLGFLLITPLYLVASVRLQEKVRSENVGRFEKASRRLEELSTKLNAATNVKEIDLVLRKFQGKGLSGPQLNQPPSKIRSELLGQLQEARRQLLQQIPSKQALQPLPLIINGIRIILSSLAYAIGFSAIARRPKAQISLLEELTGLYQTRSQAAQTRNRERQAFLKTIADSQLEQQALAAEEARHSETIAEQEPERAGEFELTSNQSTAKAEASPKRRRTVDLDYFEALSQESDPDDNEKSV